MEEERIIVTLILLIRLIWVGTNLIIKCWLTLTKLLTKLLINSGIIVNPSIIKCRWKIKSIIFQWVGIGKWIKLRISKWLVIKIIRIRSIIF